MKVNTNGNEQEERQCHVIHRGQRENHVVTLDPGSDQEPTLTWKYLKYHCFVSINEHL